MPPWRSGTEDALGASSGLRWCGAGSYAETGSRFWRPTEESRFRRGKVLRRDREVRTLGVPRHRRDPPPLSVTEELDRVDASLERLRVGRGMSGLVRREDLADVAETVGSAGDFLFEEAGRLAPRLARVDPLARALRELVHVERDVLRRVP